MRRRRLLLGRQRGRDVRRMGEADEAERRQQRNFRSSVRRPQDPVLVANDFRLGLFLSLGRR